MTIGKIMLELNNEFVTKEFRDRMENKYVEIEATETKKIQLNQEVTPKKEEIKIEPKKAEIKVEIINTKRETVQEIGKPAGIQPYEARSELEEQIFKSDKLFVVRDYMFGQYTLSEFRNLSEEELKKMNGKDRVIMKERLKRFNKEVKRLEERLANPVEKKERKTYARQDWEIEQYLADKESEKQDAIDMKKKKEFVGSSEKEIEISYKKFEEKLQQVKIVPFEEVKENMRKFEQRFERDVMESRFEEIFDEEIAEDENGTREVMNREEFRKYRWNEGAMWPPTKLELLKKDFGYGQYEMTCENDIAINGRAKKRRQKKLEQTLGKFE
jgi:hypothetical protein